MQEKSERPTAWDDAWRHTHLGQLLGHALRQFDARVRTLMVQDPAAPLALSSLADLAERAGMSKQAMADLIEQGIAWGLVQRQPDPLDRRAKRVVYTATGLEWYHSFARATAQAEAEFTAAVGEEVATVVRLALELYGADAGRPA